MAQVEPVLPDPTPPASKATIAGVVVFVATLAVLLIFFVPDAEPKVEPAESDPAKLYAKSCAICHGPQGGGVGAFPKTAGTKLSEAQVAELIEKGKGNMPSFATSFSPEQRVALA
jgi:mono/diheme cytochrome c family protein